MGLWQLFIPFLWRPSVAQTRKRGEDQASKTNKEKTQEGLKPFFFFHFDDLYKKKESEIQNENKSGNYK
jgi:hypothetical protein